MNLFTNILLCESHNVMRNGIHTSQRYTRGIFGRFFIKTINYNSLYPWLKTYQLKLGFRSRYHKCYIF